MVFCGLHQQFIVNLALLGGFALCLVACSAAESPKTEPSRLVEQKQEEPEEPVSSADANSDAGTVARRQLRRLTMTLTSELPSAQLMAEITEGNISLDQVSKQLLGSFSFSATLARELLESWKWTASYSQGARDGNSDFITGMDTPTNRKILDEAYYLILYFLQQNRPYSHWFQGRSSLVHQDVLGADFTATSTIWPGTEMSFGSYASERLAMGLASSNAARLAAARDHLFSSTGYSAQVLSNFLCSSSDHEVAHDFLALDQAWFVPDASVALEASSCASCHQSINTLAMVVPQRPSSGGLAEWMLPADHTTELNAKFFTDEVDTSTTLIETFARDPRLGSCLIKHLSKIYLRRTFSENDAAFLASAQARYLAAQRPSDVVQFLLSQPSFYENADSTQLQVLPEMKVRILQPRQMREILSKHAKRLQDLPSPFAARVAAELQSFNQSEGLDFHALEEMLSIAGHFADFVVNHELDESLPASARTFFTKLGQDTDQLDAAMIETQIVHLFYLFTGLALVGDSPTIVDLQEIWQAAPRTDASARNEGWKQIVTAILLSPHFLYY